ncbi:MAG: hypothetical protein ACREBR_01265 [bacterium]
MATIQAFRAALGRVGFDAPTQTAIIDQGIATIDDLLLVGNDQVKQICKMIRDKDNIVLTFMQHQMLDAMRYWVSSRVRQGLAISAALFTRDVANECVQTMMVDTIESNEKMKSVLSVPDKFKIDGNWEIFKESVITYFGQLKGGGRIPLKYVIRDSDNGDREMNYATDMERLICTVPLEGELFTRDNRVVYGIIKSLVLEGPGWNWIIHLDREENGRAAWKAIKDHYEGKSETSRRKDEAYKSLGNSLYVGERKNFTFEVYTNIHQKAHQDLMRMGEPVPENRKVQIFMDNIRDSYLTAGKAAVLASETMSSNFVVAANYLANFVARMKSSFDNDRRVSAFDARRPPFGKIGRGRGSGRGRGRGGGRGRGRSGDHGRSNFGEDKYHSWAEWSKLSQEQKSKIFQLREEKKKRKISAVTTADAVSNNSKTEDNAGDQFGRQVHRN